MFSDEFIDTLAKALAPSLHKLLAPSLAKVLKPESMPKQEWLTREQAAHYIGSTKEALRHMLREKLLPVYNVKGRERIKKSDIDEMFLSEQTFLTERSEEMECVLPGTIPAHLDDMAQQEHEEFELMLTQVTDRAWHLAGLPSIHPN